MSGGDVVGAGDDVEQSGLELRRLSVREEGSVVAVQVDAQRQHLAFLVDRQVAGHVKVAREAGGDEVLVAILNPLHRAADQEARRCGDHVARIDRNLVAEAATEVGRDDADVLLRKPVTRANTVLIACGAWLVM